MAESAQIIRAEEIDPKFKYVVSKMHGAEKVTLCFQCGTCTAECPVSRFSDLYKPKRIARMVQLGLKDKILRDKHLWLCTTCYTCVDHCPQDVEIANVVRVLRNISIQYTESMPLVYRELAENLMKTGFVYVIPESRIKRREELGLPPLPKTNPGEILKIFELTGLSSLIKGSQTFERVE
ncbi:MAG: 4Fe-4S dicluster domain-containing protein [Candidatus Bathyarchaeia archaeon]|nr:4Fe-4S dicluster domain-containing protein [Candidatus Bathyarchaeota archaeon]